MDKRRMDELRVKVGAKETFSKKFVRSRLKWADHVEGMGLWEVKKLVPRNCREKGCEDVMGGLH